MFLVQAFIDIFLSLFFCLPLAMWRFTKTYNTLNDESENFLSKVV